MVVVYPMGGQADTFCERIPSLRRVLRCMPRSAVPYTHTSKALPALNLPADAKFKTEPDPLRTLAPPRTGSRLPS